MKKSSKWLILIVVLCLGLGIFWAVTRNKKQEPEEEITYRYGYYSNSSTYSNSWTLDSNAGLADYSVSDKAREKRVKLKGDGTDTITILVYMCGSDLESKSAMGVYDLQEMASASLSDNINLIVYTGGTTKWHINDISTKVNQIYRVRGNGSLERLVENAGNGSMVDPSTLVSFIEWGAENFEADRYALIFWDHGSGTISGYGYDEKYPRLGSMGLDKIDQALTEAGVTFDFIGFDACLMATTETGLMLAEHADYMIASEESEPGIGWYYTDWLNKLSQNTSMATLDIGVNIVDAFISMCKSKTPSQSATLSVIDLAEMEATVPEALASFSKSTTGLLENKQYKTIAKARSGAREFSASSKIDQVDLVDMAAQLGTDEAKALTDALLGCIKYNNVSNDMANSYGLSIYFPYRSAKYTSTVLKTYDAIDMSSEYSDCIRSFATYQTSGQVSSGGQTNPYSSLTSSSYSNQNYQAQSSDELVLQLLQMFLSGDSSYSQNQSYTQYYTNPFSFLFGRSLDVEAIASTIAEDHFDADLNWKDGKIHLTSKQWELVDDLKLNVFIDDGTGYIDLGSDNVFTVDDNNDLIADKDFTWLGLSVDGDHYEVMPYYHVYTIGDQSDYKIVGRAPVKLNGEDANLVIVFSDEDPKGTIAGITYDYNYDEENAYIGKTALAGDVVDILGEVDLSIDGTAVPADMEIHGLEKGDVIQFVCDYYDYNGNYDSSWTLGDPLTVTGDFYLGDLDITDYKVLAVYEFTDIYQQTYWSAPIQ